MKLLTQFKKLQALAHIIGLDGHAQNETVELYLNKGHFSVKVGDVEIDNHTTGHTNISMPLTEDFGSAIEATETALENYIKTLTDALTN